MSTKNEGDDMTNSIEEAKERLEQVMAMKPETQPETIVRMIRVTINANLHGKM